VLRSENRVNYEHLDPGAWSFGVLAGKRLAGRSSRSYVFLWLFPYVAMPLQRQRLAWIETRSP